MKRRLKDNLEESEDMLWHLVDESDARHARRGGHGRGAKPSTWTE